MLLHLFKGIKKILVLTILFILLSFSSNIKGINIGIIELYPARIIVFSWLVYALCAGKIRALRRLVRPMLVFILFGCILSVINFNSQCIASVLVYITSFATMLMFASITNSKEDLYCLSVSILFNLIIQALLGIKESLTGEYIFNVYEHYAWHYNSFGLHMPATAFFNTNNYAVYCILSLPFIALCKSRFLILNVLSYLGYLLGIIAILLTGSRTGLLCVIVYVILYFYYNVYKTNNSKVLKIFIVLSVFVLLIIFLVNIIQFFELIFPNGSVSDEDRLPIWGNYIIICFKNLLVYGVPGCSSELLMRLVGSNIPPHCMFLEILVEYGLIGLICILTIIEKLIPNKVSSMSIFHINMSKIFLYIFLIASICPSSMSGSYYLWAMFGIFYSINNKQLI